MRKLPKRNITGIFTKMVLRHKRMTRSFLLAVKQKVKEMVLITMPMYSSDLDQKDATNKTGIDSLHNRNPGQMLGKRLVG